MLIDRDTRSRTAITLIGFQTSGKTTLGQRVGQQIGWPFWDTDALIEKEIYPMTCRDVFQTLGENYFRELEYRIVKKLSYSSCAVVASGGGTLLHPHTAPLLKKSSRLIYLKTSLPILKQRIWAKPMLPSYLTHAVDPEKALVELYAKRVVQYEKWADMTLEMDALTVDEAAQQIKDYVFKHSNQELVQRVH